MGNEVVVWNPNKEVTEGFAFNDIHEWAAAVDILETYPVKILAIGSYTVRYTGKAIDVCNASVAIAVACQGNSGNIGQHLAEKYGFTFEGAL